MVVRPGCFRLSASALRFITPLSVTVALFANGSDQPALARTPTISVSPSGDLCIGPGNDFEPESLRRVWSLTNSGSEPVPWQVEASQPWISFDGATAGDLAPSQSIEVAAEVDPFASAQGGTALVTFSDRRTATVLAQPRVRVSPQFLVGAGSSKGWTTFTRSADSLVIYVSSSSGLDQNDGLSRATPKRTIAAGAALLRDGYPDWLLLERRDVWHESFGQWKKSGRSPVEPMLISTYGNASARPQIETGSMGGLWTNGGGGSPATIDNLAIVGLSLRADAYTGGGDCVGIQLLQPSSHVLIEDCMIEGYSQNLVFQGYGGRHSDIRLRRSVIVDAYTIHSIGGHAEGLYSYAVDGLLVEENVFDHNGWSETVPGAGADIFCHNLYIDNDNSGVVVRGNIIANASSHGMQLRPGGAVINNLFVRNSIALSVGGGNDPNPGGVTAIVRGNVILDGKNIDAANPRGWGMWFANIASGSVEHNVIANNALGTQPAPLTLAGTHVGDTRPSIGVHDLVIRNNTVFNWGGGISIEGDASQITNIELTRNAVQNLTSTDRLLGQSMASTTAAIASKGNRFFSLLAPSAHWTEIGSTLHTMSYWFSLVGDSTSAVHQVAFDAPNRSVASYNATLGGPSSLDAFLFEARRQSSTNWRPTYTGVVLDRYIRQGF